MSPTTLSSNLNKINQRITNACQKINKNISDILLLAVSKTHSANAVNFAYNLGLRHFGENYLQEALVKIKQLPSDITWHFIGHIQSNKTKEISEHFSWVHTVDRLKILKRLAAQRPSHLPPLNICFEVNINLQAQKSGFPMNDLSELIKCIQWLKEERRLKLRGLMCLPKLTDNLEIQRRNFQTLHNLLIKLNQTHNLTMDTLSMGVSHDLESAIYEGSTIVRIGTALFGKRK
ncbi:YggS family pyridoxal phosphate-dependent enzyme [Thiotrichales bacterium 19S11-10]|nr:YggS family pyridoxal phosphate-dependent enzyme [Thiotrichales bacterium 19S11-10]